jgi:hypothetical protein
MVLESLKDLPSEYRYRMFAGQLPNGLEADYEYISPSLKLHYYFIKIGERPLTRWEMMLELESKN